MKSRRTILLFAVLFSGIILTAFSGCSSKNNTVTVGSKNFTEQFILAEMIAQLIEAKTDLKVERKFNLGGTMICHGALINGEIDIYPEYTGTGLTAVLKHDVISNPDAAYAAVSEGYKDKFSIRWMKPFGFNNTYTITVRNSDAEKYGWEKISDLAPMAGKLDAGFTAEFMERPDGYPGLSGKYGIEFGTAKDLDPGLMYKAIEQKEVDVICAFLTDGRIPAYKLQPLVDDKEFFPPYYAAPVVRETALNAHPKLEEVLNLLGGKINDDIMRDLNYEVDEKGRESAVVARGFLIKTGLLQN